jgi:hypothetical protein
MNSNKSKQILKKKLKVKPATQVVPTAVKKLIQQLGLSESSSSSSDMETFFGERE